MPTLSFTAPFTKNSGLVYSAQEIKSMFLHGITLDSSISDYDIEFQVLAAQKEIENFLGVKLFRQIYSETLQFNNEEWTNWGFMKTAYMVVCPLSVEGYYGQVKQTVYPKEWLSSKKESGDELYHRMIYLVPNGNTGAVTNALLYAGIIPQLGYLGINRIPNYWIVKYTTGFDVIPNDLIHMIGVLTAISMLYIVGNNTLGVAGIGSTSISIDGLSQSMSSNNYYLARIKAYNEDLQRKLKTAEGTYRGFSFGVC